MIEKGLGGRQHRRSARYITMADHANPLALLQGLDDLAVDRHAADVFDLATGDRLAIGNQRQGFQHGAGIALRTLLPQPPDPGRVTLAHLQAIAAGNLLQLKGTALTGFTQQRQGLFEHRRLRALGFLEQLIEALKRLRFARGKHKGLQQGGQFTGFVQVHRCTLESLACGWAIRSIIQPAHGREWGQRSRSAPVPPAVL